MQKTTYSGSDRRSEAIIEHITDDFLRFFFPDADEPSEEKWILVHLEVEGYRDPRFPWRMHTYFYRISDRYQRPITAIAILTDDDKNYRPNVYRYDFLGTSYEYRFNVYKVLEQDEEALKKDRKLILFLQFYVVFKDKAYNEHFEEEIASVSYHL